jgi:hypothetical protein
MENALRNYRNNPSRESALGVLHQARQTAYDALDPEYLSEYPNSASEFVAEKADEAIRHELGALEYDEWLKAAFPR